MDILESNLEMQMSPQVNGTAIVNGDKSDFSEKQSKQKWMRASNAVTIVARLPLEPIPRYRKNAIFNKLLQLDKTVASNSVKLPWNLENKAVFLTIIRRALIRYVNTVEKWIIEVQSLSTFLTF